MTTENINTKSIPTPDYQATIATIFNASNQIEVARAYISSVDDTEQMEVCAKRGVDLILENVVGSLTKHIDVLMDEKSETNKSLTQKDKSDIQSVCVPSRTKALLPVMYDYLEVLKGVSPSSCGKVSVSKEDLQETIELGLKVSFILKEGLKAVGEIISCIDQGHLAISLGWFISNVSDFLQALENIQTNLINSIDGQLWPNIAFEHSKFSFTSFLTQLPYISHHSVFDPNNVALDNFVEWYQWQEGCQSTNIRALHAAISSANATDNLDLDTLYLGSLMAGEWYALVDFINDSQDMAALLLKTGKNREIGLAS
mgnify:CR=1 FL=1